LEIVAVFPAKAAGRKKREDRHYKEARKRERGGSDGYGNYGDATGCENWTDKIIDQREVGEQRIGENISDD
jgi:hypothetical protein